MISMSGGERVGTKLKLCTAADHGKPTAITKSQVAIVYPKQAKEDKFILSPAPILANFTPSLAGGA
jgi:hypothetical protein